jgi:hypothetical protein
VLARTGATDAEQAFLTLIDRAEARSGAAGPTANEEVPA